jgi:hypothetical protein
LRAWPSTGGLLTFVWQPQTGPQGGTTFGMGDILFSAFVSPRSNGTLSWGVGPAILLPTGTNAGVGAQNSGQWCIGPTAAIVYSPGPLVMGLLERGDDGCRRGVDDAPHRCWAVSEQEGEATLRRGYRFERTRLRRSIRWSARRCMPSSFAAFTGRNGDQPCVSSGHEVGQER